MASERTACDRAAPPPGSASRCAGTARGSVRGDIHTSMEVSMGGLSRSLRAMKGMEKRTLRCCSSSRPSARTCGAWRRPSARNWRSFSLRKSCSSRVAMAVGVSGGNSIGMDAWLKSCGSVKFAHALTVRRTAPHRNTGPIVPQSSRRPPSSSHPHTAPVPNGSAEKALFSAAARWRSRLLRSTRANVKFLDGATSSAVRVCLAAVNRARALRRRRPAPRRT